MKVVIEREAMKANFATVGSICPTSSTIKTVKCIKVETGEKGRLVLEATNLEVSARVIVPAAWKEEGSFLISGAMLSKIISKGRGEEIDIATKENKATIKCGTAKFNVPTLKADEFPTFPVPTETEEVKLDSSDLLEKLSAALPAVSNDHTRHILNGVRIGVLDGKLSAVATDGRRCTIIGEVGSADDGIVVIVPTTAVTQVVRVLKDYEGEVTIELTEEDAIFTMDETVIRTKLVEGTFPNVKQIIPDDKTDKLVFDVSALRDGLDQTMMVDPGTVKFVPEKGKLFMSAAGDVGDVRIEVECEITDDAIAFAVNPGYVLDAVKLAGGDKVHVQIADDMSPMRITLDAIPELIAIVMPLKID